MRCEDCVDGEIDPAECCDERVAEEVEILNDFASELRTLVDATDDAVAALTADDNDIERVRSAITALIRADYNRRACGGVIDGLIDNFGDNQHRALRRERPW